MLLVGCSSPTKHYIKIKPKVNKKHIKRSEKIMRCIERMINMEVKPLDASNICSNIYKR